MNDIMCNFLNLSGSSPHPCCRFMGLEGREGGEVGKEGGVGRGEGWRKHGEDWESE